MNQLSDLPKKWSEQAFLVPGVLNEAGAKVTIDRLRYEARVAYLDGRTAQARKFNRYADILARCLANKEKT
jgi:hypothetical protein